MMETAIQKAGWKNMEYLVESSGSQNQTGS